MSMPSGMELVIIVIIILILFGGKKIPELAKGLGSGIRKFKKAIKEDDNEEVANKPTETDKKTEIPTQKEEIKNPIVLFSTLSEKGTYSLKLISDKEINLEKSTVSYIVVTGNILDTDSNIDIFSLSLNGLYLFGLFSAQRSTPLYARSS